MNEIAVIDHDAYHRDEVGDRPSLSASIACVLCTSSPKHAWTKHPRLNPDFARTESDKFDLGTVAHQLFLEGGADRADVLEFENYRTNAAKAARDESRAAGRVPILAHEWGAVERMVKAAADQLAAIDADPPLFTDGKPEQTLVWEEEGVLCRARLDWLRDDFSAIDDYKTTSASANPEKWVRTMYGIGADVQAAFYLRGLDAACGCDKNLGRQPTADFRWAVQETYPPYALSVVSLAPSALELANAKVDYAIDIWKRCLETDTWPAYGTKVAYAEMPAYMEAAWMEREAREDVAA